jgi:hypothetical protein
VLFPAWVAELALGWTALAVTAIVDEPLSAIDKIDLMADRIHDWRSGNDKDPFSVWLSIRPE